MNFILTNDETGTPLYGFEFNGTIITDPTRSECSRFEVEPKSTYGLTDSDLAELKALNENLITIARRASDWMESAKSKMPSKVPEHLLIQSLVRGKVLTEAESTRCYIEPGCAEHDIVHLHVANESGDTSHWLCVELNGLVYKI